MNQQQQQASSQSRMTSASFDVSSLNLASLSINNNEYQHHPSAAQEQALSSRGWGSTETRKAYTSLRDLASCNHQQQAERPSSGLIKTPDDSSNSLQSASDSEYFVGGGSDNDVMDCDDNFF
jgi:hypothetical protein